MNTKDFLSGITARIEAMSANPARAILEEVEATRAGLLHHNQNCTNCEPPKKKARAAYVQSYNLVCGVMIEAVQRQVHDACIALGGYENPNVRQDATTIMRAASATAQNTLWVLRALTVAIHDKEPDFTAFDTLTEALTRLADATDANRAKAKGGLN